MYENLNSRKYVKLHQDTQCIKMVFDKAEKKLYDVDMDYITKHFRKIPVQHICYDDHVLSCFYDSTEHPLSYIFPSHIIESFKTFAQCGMTSFIDKHENNDIVILIVPNTKIKHFKDGVIQ